MLQLKDFLLAIALTFFAAASSFAQQTVNVPVMTGSKTGSYFAFTTQAAKVCSNDVSLQVLESAGSTENIDAMEDNKVAVIAAQLDVLDLYKRTKNMSNFKLLVPLFQEQVHFIVRNDVTKKEGGFNIGGFNVGGTKVQLSSIKDLVDKNVAAAGGSHKTAKVISYLAGIRMNLIEEKGADAVISGVISGKYDAGILVGAQPLGTIRNMGDKQSTIKLLPITDDVAEKLKSVYTKGDPLNYRGMGEGGDNVPAVQVMSALITQNYPKSSMGDAVYAFQKCLLREARIQATMPGMHPAWRNLQLNVGLNWPTWEYEGASVTKSTRK